MVGSGGVIRLVTGASTCLTPAPALRAARSPGAATSPGVAPSPSPSPASVRSSSDLNSCRIGFIRPGRVFELEGDFLEVVRLGDERHGAGSLDRLSHATRVNVD